MVERITEDRPADRRAPGARRGDARTPRRMVRIPAYGDVSARPRLPHPLGTVITDLNPNLLPFGRRGAGDRAARRYQLRVDDHRSIVLNSARYRSRIAAELELGLHARLWWARERRVCHALRVRFPDDRTAVVANFHATSYHDRRLADAELRRAASFAVGLAERDEAVVLAGDFDLTVVTSPTLRELSTPDWGFSPAGPGLDHVLVRGSRSRMPSGTGPKTSAGTRASSCRIMRPWSSRSHDVRGGSGAVPGARALRVPERRDVRADRRAGLDAIGWSSAGARGGSASRPRRVRARSSSSGRCVRAEFASCSAFRSRTSRSPRRRQRVATSCVNGLELAAGDEIVTTDSEHFGLIGPIGVEPGHGARRQGARTARRRGAGRDPRRGRSSDEAHRDLGHPVDHRPSDPVARAARANRVFRCSSTARSRSAPCRSTRPRRTSTPFRPEVALRPRPHRRALRPRPRSAAARSAELPVAARVRPRRGDLRAPRGADRFDTHFAPLSTTGRPPRGVRDPPGVALRARRRRCRRAHANGSPSASTS